ESAQAEASSAWYAADRARASAIAAGKDAEAALKAATEAFTIAVTKHREEAEARRKAAVEAKEKARNDEGARAREMYRCGQAYIPCDPQGFARWCQHNEIYCDILAYGDEFGAAMNDLLDMGKEIAGLGNLEKCMDNKDFENCWELGTDVLIGAKLKALDKTFDALKLLKRGCKAAGRATRSAGSMSLAAAASSNFGCLEGAVDHDVYDPVTGNRITDIDRFEKGVLWEEKTAIYGDTSWLDKHVNKKLAAYLRARAELPEAYRSAPIGFRFTKSGVDSRFRAALEERFEQLRRQHPDLDLRLEISD
ncbi:hypothetical protein ACFY1W_18785, partial [Streptomyces rubiginosohelvolus]